MTSLAAQRMVAWSAVSLALGVVAWLSPAPDRVTDSATYLAIADQTIVPDCSDLHCFRVLVPWTLGAVPGPDLLKWKAYAAAMNGLAAVAVFALCRQWALSNRVALLASTLSAVGFGSLYTVHDVFTADPLMFALGPILTLLLFQERLVWAGAIASVGVLAKEFAAAPAYIAMATAFVWGRRDLAGRLLVVANCALIVWLVLQLTLIVGFNYSYADNPSTHLLSGGYLATWWTTLSPRGAISAMVNQFGALWLLAPAGLLLAPSALRRYAAMAVPVAAIFAYVQQPDRALWNFHFLVTPLAALVLVRTRKALAWATVAVFALMNLRVGAQLSMVPPARITLSVSLLLAAAVIASVARTGAFGSRTAEEGGAVA